MGIKRTIFGGLLIMMFLVTFVSAQDTRVNITISETVYENITFAEDFYLEEAQKFVLVDGKINISNPSNESVYDIYVDITNTRTFDRNMENEAGRNASQIGFIGQYKEYGLVGNTINNVTLLDDLNDDGTNDTIYVNNTHIIINITNLGIDSIRFKDESDNPTNLTAPTGLATKEIVAHDYVMIGGKYYGRVSLNGTLNSSHNDDEIPATFTMQVKRLTNTLRIFVPELGKKQSTLMNYTVFADGGQGVLIQSPLDLDTEYLNEYSTKILAGHDFKVRDTLTNKPPQAGLNLNITLINITMNLEPVSWNGSVFNFSFVNLTEDGDYVNVFACNATGGDCNTNVTDNFATRTPYQWIWIPNSGTLNPNQEVNITYDVRAPDSVPTSNSYHFLTQDIYFYIDHVVSNLTVTDVKAKAALQYNLSKQIWNESSDLRDNNVTWRIDSEISTPINITYNVTNITLWVTHNMNPNNKTALNTSYNWSSSIINGLLNQSSATFISTQADSWYFDYTDGSSASAPPPIIWMKPEYHIYNGYNQILNKSVTQVGKDLYMKYIYVVNGYWLTVDKKIVNYDEDKYNITINVENIGNGFTPDGFVVQVYDFIPSEFNLTENAMSDYSYPAGTLFSTPLSTSNSAEYNGTAYKWAISGSRTNDVGGNGIFYNASFAPRGMTINGVPDLDKWNFSYQVVGKGDYKVTDLYIVGLDPIKVDGAGASPLIAIKEGLKSSSYELLFALIVVVLLVVNVANLMMSQRIELKLEKVKHQSKKYDDLKDEIDQLKSKLNK